jgi:cobalamin biosynthesis Co2+ chelatase CbiK
MANYTIQQCLSVRGITDEVKAYLNTLANSKLPNSRNKQFTADDETQLVQVLNDAVTNYNKRKEKHNQRKAKSEESKECHSIIDSLIKAQNGNRRILSAEELLPMLEELKEKVLREKQFAKVADFISNSGMTKEQIIEYLNKYK